MIRGETCDTYISLLLLKPATSEWLCWAQILEAPVLPTFSKSIPHVPEFQVTFYQIYMMDFELLTLSHYQLDYLIDTLSKATKVRLASRLSSIKMIVRNATVVNLLVLFSIWLTAFILMSMANNWLFSSTGVPPTHHGTSSASCKLSEFLIYRFCLYFGVCFNLVCYESDIWFWCFQQYPRIFCSKFRYLRWYAYNECNHIQENVSKPKDFSKMRPPQLQTASRVRPSTYVWKSSILVASASNS